jgi:hypothetical protein
METTVVALDLAFAAVSALLAILAPSRRTRYLACAMTAWALIEAAFYRQMEGAVGELMRRIW